MPLLESFLAIIAPHVCEGCGAEGNLLCGACAAKLELSPEQCYRCRRVNGTNRTCRSCRSQTKLTRVQALTPYRGLAKRLIWRLKFRNARAAGREIGRLLAPLITQTDGAILITHVPTATSRVRRRGYDQAAVIARELAQRTEARYAPLLYRSGQHRQVGTSGALRRLQVAEAFRVRRHELVAGAHIVLVDDVITTGATLEAAVKVLKDAGAKKVEAIVFARA